jgi:Tfp pilus assembly protein PilX
MLARLRQETGMALVMSVGMLAVLTIAGTTLVAYTTSNARSGGYSKQNELAFSLAEAGLNNAMAVLSNSSNDALKQETLPSTEATASTAAYEGGTAKWYGVLDRGLQEWTITAIGLQTNPTGPATGQVRRQLTARVPVVPTNTQTNQNPVWNYIYARATGSTCDVALANNLTGQSRFYVAGNLCLNNNVGITSEYLNVRGNVDLANNAFVGTTSTRIETFVGGNCRYGGGSWTTPNCSGNQDGRHIFSKLMPSGNVGVSNEERTLTDPVANFAHWYEHAAPGPALSCTSSSGTPPTFDGNYPTKDNSAGTFELTPASSYACRVGPSAWTTLPSALNATQTTINVSSATGFPGTSFRIRIDDEYMTVTGGFGTTTWTVTRGVNGSTAASHIASQTVTWDDSDAAGMLVWNATTKTLTVKGTIYIDGSASITNGFVNTYNGQSTIYLSGVFYINNSSKLCGGVSGSDCAFAEWNPNYEMLTVATDGSGGLAGVGNGILLSNNGTYQGGLYATNDVEFANNARSDGPVVGRTVKFANNVQNDQFPTIVEVPTGQPGNDIVRAQPKPPQKFAG